MSASKMNDNERLHSLVENSCDDSKYAGEAVASSSSPPVSPFMPLQSPALSSKSFGVNFGEEMCEGEVSVGGNCWDEMSEESKVPRTSHTGGLDVDNFREKRNGTQSCSVTIGRKTAQNDHSSVGDASHGRLNGDANHDIRDFIHTHDRLVGDFLKKNGNTDLLNDTSNFGTTDGVLTKLVDRDNFGSDGSSVENEVKSENASDHPSISKWMDEAIYISLSGTLHPNGDGRGQTDNYVVFGESSGNKTSDDLDGVEDKFERKEFAVDDEFHHGNQRRNGMVDVSGGRNEDVGSNNYGRQNGDPGVDGKSKVAVSGMEMGDPDTAFPRANTSTLERNAALSLGLPLISSPEMPSSSGSHSLLPLLAAMSAVSPVTKSKESILTLSPSSSSASTSTTSFAASEPKWNPATFQSIGTHRSLTSSNSSLLSYQLEPFSKHLESSPRSLLLSPASPKVKDPADVAAPSPLSFSSSTLSSASSPLSELPFSVPHGSVSLSSPPTHFSDFSAKGPCCNGYACLSDDGNASSCKDIGVSDSSNRSTSAASSATGMSKLVNNNSTGTSKSSNFSTYCDLLSHRNTNGCSSTMISTGDGSIGRNSDGYQREPHNLGPVTLGHVKDSIIRGCEDSANVRNAANLCAPGVTRGGIGRGIFGVDEVRIECSGISSFGRSSTGTVDEIASVLSGGSIDRTKIDAPEESFPLISANVAPALLRQLKDSSDTTSPMTLSQSSDTALPRAALSSSLLGVPSSALSNTLVLSNTSDAMTNSPDHRHRLPSFVEKRWLAEKIGVSRATQSGVEAVNAEGATTGIGCSVSDVLASIIRGDYSRVGNNVGSPSICDNGSSVVSNNVDSCGVHDNPGNCAVGESIFRGLVEDDTANDYFIDGIDSENDAVRQRTLDVRSIRLIASIIQQLKSEAPSVTNSSSSKFLSCSNLDNNGPLVSATPLQSSSVAAPSTSISIHDPTSLSSPSPISQASFASSPQVSQHLVSSQSLPSPTLLPSFPSRCASASFSSLTPSSTAHQKPLCHESQRGLTPTQSLQSETSAVSTSRVPPSSSAISKLLNMSSELPVSAGPAPQSSSTIASSTSPTKPVAALLSLQQRMTKTKMCRFNAKDKCNKNHLCPFAHSVVELREQPNLYKTKKCESFDRKNGFCERGDKCHFAHSDEELRSTTEFYKTAMCPRFAAEGKCISGESCRYAHSDVELRNRPPTSMTTRLMVKSQSSSSASRRFSNKMKPCPSPLSTDSSPFVSPSLKRRAKKPFRDSNGSGDIDDSSAVVDLGFVGGGNRSHITTIGSAGCPRINSNLKREDEGWVNPCESSPSTSMPHPSSSPTSTTSKSRMSTAQWSGQSLLSAATAAPPSSKPTKDTVERLSSLLAALSSSQASLSQLPLLLPSEDLLTMSASPSHLLSPVPSVSPSGAMISSTRTSDCPIMSSESIIHTPISNPAVNIRVGNLSNENTNIPRQELSLMDAVALHQILKMQIRQEREKAMRERLMHSRDQNESDILLSQALQRLLYGKQNGSARPNHTQHYQGQLQHTQETILNVSTEERLVKDAAPHPYDNSVGGAVILSGIDDAATDGDGGESICGACTAKSEHSIDLTSLYSGVCESTRAIGSFDFQRDKNVSR